MHILDTAEWKNVHLKMMVDLKAFGSAIEHARQSPAANFVEFWNSITSPSLLFWISYRLLDRKAVVWAACQCAREALKYVPEGETRPRTVIETAERWCHGQATFEETKAAADIGSQVYAAYAHRNTAADHAAYAAYAAVYSTFASDAAAAIYASDSVDAVARIEDRDKQLVTLAGVIRQSITPEIIASAISKKCELSPYTPTPALNSAATADAAAGH